MSEVKGARILAWWFDSDNDMHVCVYMFVCGYVCGWVCHY